MDRVSTDEVGSRPYFLGLGLSQWSPCRHGRRRFLAWAFGEGHQEQKSVNAGRCPRNGNNLEVEELITY